VEGTAWKWNIKPGLTRTKWFGPEQLMNKTRQRSNTMTKASIYPKFLETVFPMELLFCPDGYDGRVKP
jgi:hypothetical protein